MQAAIHSWRDAPEPAPAWAAQGTTRVTNGYVAYRLAHVPAELGDLDVSLALLRQAVDAGLLSLQLMRHEEGCGLAFLVEHPSYRSLIDDLQQRIAGVRDEYVPLLETA